jgi:hypothetical protein
MKVDSSVVDPDPGSGAFLIPDPRSRTYILESLMTIFWVKSSIILCKLDQILTSPVKNKIIFNFVIFVATKKGTNFFHSSLMLLFLDPGLTKIMIRDPGSGINILDPQH